MKKLRTANVFVISLVYMSALLLQGCGTAGTTGMITAGGAATGALIGHAASNKNPYWTAGGAAGGVLVGSLLNYKLQKQMQEAEQQGFDRAMNQSARQHYWILQNLQKASDCETEHNGYGYYPIIRPEMTVDGVIFNESME
jgi:hypothetical protein